MNDVRFHAWFAPYVPDLQAQDGVASIFAMRYERHTIGVEYHIVDLVLTSGRKVIAIPFIVVTPEGLIFPRACDALEAAFLAECAQRIGHWLGTEKPPSGTLKIFESDTDLVQFAQRGQAPGAPIVPGFASHQMLFDTVARYQYAATRACGRSVLDLNPLMGFGTRTLRALARELRALGGADMQLAQRLGLWPLESQVGARAFELILALDCPPQGIDSAIAAAQRASAAHASVLVTARGAAGERGLRAHGEPQRMFRPAMEAAGPLDEYALWIAPAPRAQAAPPRAASARAQSTGLRVLFVLRPSAQGTSGGDVVQVERTAAALRERGHTVLVTCEQEPQTAGYDIVHLTNLTTGPEGIHQARAVRHFAGPIVLMPIFIDHADETVWGMGTASALFYSCPADSDLATRLDQLALRTVAANNVPPPPARPEMYPDYTAMQRELLSYVDFLVANAYSEVHRIYRYLESNIPFAIAPSATDAHTYGPATRAAFVEKYGIEDFILTTGRIEPRKNQLLLLWATRAMSDRRIVIVGKNNDPLYGFFTQVYARENVVFLPQMPEAELAGAYAAARVFVLPSWDEVVSLSALNAGLSGPSLVLTRNGCEHEYFRDDAQYCDPADAAGIASAIDTAWNSHEVLAERRRAMNARVRSEYTWEHAAAATEAAYYRVLAHNPRGARRLATVRA